MSVLHPTPPPPPVPTATSERRATFWLWLVLAVAVGGTVALVGLPLLVPTLASSVSGQAPHGYWYISRASAYVAYALLWLSMLAGLGITSMLARIWPGMLESFELHRITGLLGLGFAIVHALILLGDQYINYTLGQVLVPFLASSYRPEWVGFGQVAIYLLLLVTITSYMRERIGTQTWRLIHALSFALFLMALIHGLQSGTDSHDWWAVALYVVSAVSVLAGTIYRVLAVRSGQARGTLAASGLIATGGKAQPRPAVPTHPGRAAPANNPRHFAQTTNGKASQDDPDWPFHITQRIYG